MRCKRARDDMYNMLKSYVQYNAEQEERFVRRNKDSVEIKKTERKFGRRTN
jgi:hypothetical protein